MAKSGYSCVADAVALPGGGTAKSVLGVRAAADFGVDLKKFTLGFDGVSAAAVPVTVHICYATFAANAPGTNSTSVTVVQQYGRALTPGFVAGKNWTAEPTVLTVIKTFTLTPNGGTIDYDYPLGDTPDSAFAEGFVIRCNTLAVVNVTGTLEFERC